MPSLQFYLLAHLAWLFRRKILALSLVQSFKKKINKGYCCSRYSKVKGRKTKMNTKEKNNKKQKTCCVVNFFDVRGFLIWNKQQKLTFFGINWVFGIFTTPPPLHSFSAYVGRLFLKGVTPGLCEKKFCLSIPILFLSIL